MKKFKQRYVGVSPFSIEQKDLFFGREGDIEKLYALVNAHQQVLLYGKSGLGKSSLIDAGLLPKLQEKLQIKVIKIRFGAYQEGKTLSLLEIMANFLPKKDSFLDKIIENENSLWYKVKSWQLAQEDLEILFIFDQFEELFGYPEEDIFMFKKQMADLLYSAIPKNFRKVLQIKEKKNADLLSKKERLKLNKSLKIKILMAIREDRYSQMNLLTDYLPDSMHNRYALLPLDKTQARQAIIAPAQKEGDFDSQRFDYQPDAIEKILNYLTKDNTQSVETTQLQILCNRLENLNLKEIKVEDIPNFEDIFLQFYEESISQFTENEQIGIRRFVENELIKKEQRISVDTLSSLEIVSQNSLDILVNAHLLRAERNHMGNIAYELSHDTLVAPILQAKSKRESEEAQQEQARQEAEKLRLGKERLAQERLENQKNRNDIKKFSQLLKYALKAIFRSVVLLEELNAGKQGQLCDHSNLSLTYYEKINSLNFSGYELTEIPSELFFCKELWSINLSNNPKLNIIGIIKKFKYLKKLETLELRANNLTELPNQIGNVSSLKKLYLSANQLSVLPQQIGKLSNLIHLDMWNNNLTILPVQIKKIKNLRRIILGMNPKLNLSDAFEKLEKLDNLKYLDLSSNNLTTLPNEIIKLKNLSSLSLYENDDLDWLKSISIINKIQKTILFTTDNTKFLDQKDTLIVGISLKMLLKVLPLIKIEQIKIETKLDFLGAGLTILPNQIGKLKHLTELDLGYNFLSDLPIEIGQLKNLIFLNLEYNDLNTLPTEIGQLEKLQILNLKDNNFSEEEQEKIRKLLPNCEVGFE